MDTLKAKEYTNGPYCDQDQAAGRTGGAGKRGRVGYRNLTPDLMVALESKIERREAAQFLAELSENLRSSLTHEEIEAELAAAKAERLARKQTEQA